MSTRNATKKNCLSMSIHSYLVQSNIELLVHRRSLPSTGSFGNESSNHLKTSQWSLHVVSHFETWIYIYTQYRYRSLQGDITSWSKIQLCHTSGRWLFRFLSRRFWRWSSMYPMWTSTVKWLVNRGDPQLWTKWLLTSICCLMVQKSS